MTHEQLTVSVAIASWKNAVGRVDKILSELTEEQFLQEVAPGKNRIVYLLGHLTAVHDSIHTILGVGERLLPELDAIFVSKPDKTITQLPPVPELKKHWTHVNNSLLEQFARLSPQEWLERHMAMSDTEAFGTLIRKLTLPGRLENRSVRIRSSPLTFLSNRPSTNT